MQSDHHGHKTLLLLAVDETESYANNATGVFTRLFCVRLGGTAAGGNARLRFLDNLMDTADDRERSVVVDALIHSLTPMGWRLVGAEIQGSKPTMSSWLPPTKEAYVEYMTGCLSRLARIAVQDRSDWPADRARAGLGRQLRSWIDPDYMAAIERAVHDVSSVGGAWPEAIEGLTQFLRYDGESSNPEIVQRVEALLLILRPVSLEDRIYLLVTAMPWDYPAGENLKPAELGRRQEEALRSLALDLSQAPVVLEKALPQLSRGEQRKAFLFGKVLGGLPENVRPYVWRRRIVRAALDVPAADRNLDLLVGYFVGIARRWPKLAMPLKGRLLKSPSIASVLPRLCGCLGVGERDVQLIVKGLAEGILSPASLRQWTIGGALAGLAASEVAQLFDTLLAQEGDEANLVAVELVGAYSHAAPHIDDLRRQIRECVSRCADRGEWQVGTMASYHLEQLVGWMLAKGPHDADARAIASDMAEIMVAHTGSTSVKLPSSIICTLLSDFPEVVWPRIGNAIVADDQPTWRIAEALGVHFRKDLEPPILRLPVETLFAWCRAHPKTAPAFAARVLPILTTPAGGTSLHPTFRMLIDEFGEREGVLAGVESNMGTYSWVGSMTDYYRRFLGPFDALTDHQKPAIRYWAKGMILGLQAAIDRARDHDAELDAEWEI